MAYGIRCMVSGETLFPSDEVLKLGCCGRVVLSSYDRRCFIWEGDLKRCKWCNAVEKNNYVLLYKNLENLDINLDEDKRKSQMESQIKLLKEQVQMKEVEIKSLNEALAALKIETQRNVDLVLLQKLDLLEGKLTQKLDQIFDSKVEQVVEKKMVKFELKEKQTQIENIQKINQSEEKFNHKIDQIFNTKLEEIVEHKLNKITADLTNLIENLTKPNEHEAEFETDQFLEEQNSNKLIKKL